jgi:tetratricopeptide (TPR) repeat protein
MGHIEKTVFLSYRRTNVPWALNIFQNLTQYGYDVFFDFTGIASGDFEGVILENIRSRAHFLVLLTPSALERCGDPEDWLRREIEEALDTGRNIVPLMFEGFDFGTPTISKQLVGKLAQLKKYNALNIPADYFLEAMGRLRDRFLNVALEAVPRPRPASAVARQAATEQKAAAAEAPKVAGEELTAQQWFERGYNAPDLDEKLRFYGNAIRIKPDYPEAFYNRGIARKDKADVKGAFQDYDEAIRLKPDYAEPYYARGALSRDQGDLDSALENFETALRLKPDFANAYVGRANVKYDKRDPDGALPDYNEALRLNPAIPEALTGRGNVRYLKGEYDQALQDYSEAVRLRPEFAYAYNTRGLAYYKKGNFDAALADFDKALALRPGYPDAIKNRDFVRNAMPKQAKTSVDT